MTKLLYLAAMALLGLGLTVAQNTSPQSDTSNSSKTAQTQNSTTPNRAKPTPGHTDPGTTNQSRPSENATPNTTVQDQQNSTTSTTGATGQNDTQPSTSTMGTTGSTAEPESSEPANKGATVPQNGTTPDQQPNSSTNPTPTPHLVMKSQNLNSTPAARAIATHTPDPGTCMNPAALDGQAGNTAARPACD